MTRTLTTDANGFLSVLADLPDGDEIDYVERLTDFTTTNAVGIGDDIPGFLIEVPPDPIALRPFLLDFYVPNVWDAQANTLAQLFLRETTPAAPASNWSSFNRGATVQDSAPVIVKKRLDSSPLVTRTFQASAKTGTAAQVATLSAQNAFGLATPIYLQATYL